VWLFAANYDSNIRIAGEQGSCLQWPAQDAPVLKTAARGIRSFAWRAGTISKRDATVTLIPRCGVDREGFGGQ
jgi:hypothetical protein